MKKFLTIFLMLVCWTSLSGFTNVETGAVLYSNGKVSEIISVQYNEEDAIALETDLEDLNSKFQTVGITVKEYLLFVISSKISLTTNLSSEDKAYLQNNISVATELREGEAINELIIVVSYNTKQCWDYMCGDIVINATTTTETNILTSNLITEMEMKLSNYEISGVQKSIFEIAYQKIQDNLDVYYNNVSTILPATYDYTYATPTKRIHSNATDIIYDFSSGYTYHTWSFDNFDNNTLIFWQTKANSYIWYCLALTLAGVFAIVLFIKSKRKKINDNIEILDK